MSGAANRPSLGAASVTSAALPQRSSALSHSPLHRCTHTVQPTRLAPSCHDVADAAARRYPTSAYYTAKLLASLPFNIAIALSFILTVYGMVGLRKELWAGAEIATIAVLMSLISMQVGAGRL